MWNLPVKCCCLVTRPLTEACIKNTILDKGFSITCFSFSLELLEQVRKYLPLLLFFCISKQIFKLFYVRTSPLALSAVLPSVVNAAVVPRAALPPLLFPNAHRQAAASPHTFQKDMCSSD